MIKELTVEYIDKEILFHTTKIRKCINPNSPKRIYTEKIVLNSDYIASIKETAFCWAINNYLADDLYKILPYLQNEKIKNYILEKKHTLSSEQEKLSNIATYIINTKEELTQNMVLIKNIWISEFENVTKELQIAFGEYDYKIQTEERKQTLEAFCYSLLKNVKFGDRIDFDDAEQLFLRDYGVCSNNFRETLNSLANDYLGNKFYIYITEKEIFFLPDEDDIEKMCQTIIQNMKIGSSIDLEKVKKKYSEKYVLNLEFFMKRLHFWAEIRSKELGCRLEEKKGDLCFLPQDMETIWVIGHDERLHWGDDIFNHCFRG